jgi:hypothetical protein
MVPALHVSSPNGGEVLTQETTHLVEWTAPANATIFRLRSSTDGGTSWQWIGRVDGTTSYNWTVPVENSTNVLLKVTASDITDVWLGNDVSNAPFTIQP